MNRDQFCELSGLTKTQVNKAIRLLLLNPKNKNQLDLEDLAVGRILKRSLDMGISLEELEYYLKMAQQIVEHEMAIRKKVIHGKTVDEMLALRMEMTSIARSFRGYVIDRIFQERVANQRLNGEDSD